MQETKRETEQRERDILWLFDIGLILKAVNGAIEVVASLVIAFVPRTVVVTVVNFATAGELSESDRTDLIAQFLQSIAHAFAVSNHFLVSLYLFVHGFIKIVLVGGVFAGKRLAYPLFMLALIIFGTYELYLGLAKQHPFLGALGVFDFILLGLAAHEYRRRYPGARFI